MRTREKKLTTTVHRYVEADDKNSDAHYKNSNGQNFPAEHQNSTAEHQGRLRLLLLVLPMRDTVSCQCPPFLQDFGQLLYKIVLAERVKHVIARHNIVVQHTR